MLSVGRGGEARAAAGAAQHYKYYNIIIRFIIRASSRTGEAWAVPGAAVPAKNIIINNY